MRALRSQASCSLLREGHELQKEEEVKDLRVEYLTGSKETFTDMDGWQYTDDILELVQNATVVVAIRMKYVVKIEVMATR